MNANATLAAYHARRAAHFAAIGDTVRADAQSALAAIYAARAQA